jgi:hypothetical protein
MKLFRKLRNTLGGITVGKLLTKVIVYFVNLKGVRNIGLRVIFVIENPTKISNFKFNWLGNEFRIGPITLE